MRRRPIYILCMLLFYYSHQVGFCGTRGNPGFKYFKNYTPLEYKEAHQNWCIVQDKRGVLYVANQEAVLTFDGISWRVIEVPNKQVRSVAIDDTGTIYVGGSNEIGFLAPGSKGTLKYHSLVKHLKESQKNFSIVYKAHATKEGIYFYTKYHLFRWDPKRKEFDVWYPEPNHRFNTSFICSGKYFVHQRKFGLGYIEGNMLKLVSGKETFASMKIYMMSPYDQHRILIGTRTKGFYLYDGKNVIPFPMEADGYLKEAQLYYGIRLSSSPGDFALATRQGGLVVIDSQGRIKEILTKEYGLQDGAVKYVFEDFQGNLWLCLNKGISKIEYNSPFMFYDDRNGLPGLALSVIKHRNVLYTGTSRGLFKFEAPFIGKFHCVSNITSYCWSILATGNSLLAATTHGLYQVETSTYAKRKVLEGKTYFLLQSRREKNRIWVGREKGWASIYWNSTNNQWGEEYIFNEIKEEIKTIIEDEKGNLWLGPGTSGVLKVEFSKGEISSQPKVTRFNDSHGLPKAEEVKIFKAADHIIYATEKGLYRFDKRNQTFIPDSTLGEQYAGGENSEGVFRIVEDDDRHIWFHSLRRNIRAVPKSDRTYFLNEAPFRRLPLVQVNAFYPDPNERIVWFAGNEGLIRYDKTLQKNYQLDFPISIRQVMINGKLLFNGDKSNQLFPIIDYKDRNIRFRFAAPFFEAEDETRYQWLLEGYDQDWSDWTSETQKDYTNLHAGGYTFRVRAKNVYENISKEAQFQFKVLPPWYQRWWAYLIYVIAAFFAVFLLLKWRSRKLILEKEKLEHIIHQRTQEIKEKNQQLEEQSEKLKEMDKVKSRFFANISHEFRTPLTLLMGPLEQMIADCSDDEKEKKRKLTLMLRNAQRLLRLINQLLELSKIDSGKMKLQAAKTNIISFVKGIADSFRFLAQQRELELVFHTEIENENLILYIDPRKMEDIMSNLLLNAVKFTPAGGEVRVTVKENPGAVTNFPERSVEIWVSDTGPGIPADQLTHIFDRFFQADSTYEYHQKGSGIGLALSKELVELHHGTIDARSREGEGTAFIIQLPLGSAHLASDEIAEADMPAGVKVGVPMEIESETADNDVNDAAKLETDFDASVQEKDIILVVEDSADMRDYIRGALEPDYTVVDAENGREGIQKAQEIIPDLIISDIMMPEVDGYELCRVLKSDVMTSHVPVILLTARASEENILQGLETGADDYITKPFSTKILSARIKNLIDVRSQLRMNINRELTLQPVKTSVSKIDQEFLHDLHKVINENLADEEFNVEQLCKKLYMSRTTLYRKVLAISGLTPTEYIRSYRLKRGAELLKQKYGTVLEVSVEVGFSNSSYFAKCFKEKFHQLPSQYHAGSRQ